VEGDGAAGNDEPLKHPLVRRLLPEYLEKLGALEATTADLKGQLAAAEEEAESAEDEELLLDQSLVDVKALKSELSARRSTLRTLQGELLDRLDSARLTLRPGEAQALVLQIERERLAEELDRYASEQQQQAAAAVENWWSKYRTALQEIEHRREIAVGELRALASGLGYA
jgi:type I restriction enzyme M protein